jgi:hypothetical protein
MLCLLWPALADFALAVHRFRLWTVPTDHNLRNSILLNHVLQLLRPPSCTLQQTLLQ